MIRRSWLLLLFVLAGSACQEPLTPATVSPVAATPAPTPELNVTFATLTPGPGAELRAEQSDTVTRPAPTATATQAPVLYTVQSGDTMVGIAAANGLTLDQLLALNPDVQPELLLVGQQIILPPLPTAAAPPMMATNQPRSLQVNGLAQFSSASGGTWVLGEVHNAGQQATELVQVEVTLSDPGGRALGNETLWLTPLTLAAGGKAPFGVLFQDVETPEARAGASIAGGRPVFDLGNRYLDLAVSGAQVTIGRSPIEVVGRLENVGAQPAGQVSVITTFYDDRGLVTGFHELAIEGTILPGESAEIHFIALPPGGRVDSYSFTVQAIIASAFE